MSDIQLIIAVVILILLSAFFSGTETGIYRLSRFRLRLGIQQRRSLFGVLDKVMADSSGVIFSILIGNNLANSFAASLVTYMFLQKNMSHANAEFYATIIITPCLFVFGELMPKNLYFYTADWIMPRLAPLVYAIHKVFVYSGAVGILKILSRVFSFLMGASTVSAQTITAAQRHHIRQIIKETQEEGMLSPVQTQIMERLINIPSVRTGTVRVPLQNVVMVPVEMDKNALFNRLKETVYRQLPVYKGDRTNIIGYIDIYETLDRPEDFQNLDSFIKPISFLNAEMPVIEALNTMRNNHITIAVIARYGRLTKPQPVGIVTMKDLVEELVGELSEW